jgi:hypothetical protein
VRQQRSQRRVSAPQPTKEHARADIDRRSALCPFPFIFHTRWRRDPREEGFEQEGHPTPTPTSHIGAREKKDLNKKATLRYAHSCCIRRMHHAVQFNHIGGAGGGFTTTAFVALVGLAIGYVFDAHPFTRRLTPYIQPTMERLQRHHYSLSSYDDPSDHRPPTTTQTIASIPTPPTPNSPPETAVYPTTLSPFTNSHSQPTYECPLTGNILYVNIPPNAHLSFVFVTLALVLHTIFLRCNVLRNRRELDFLLHLQNQIQTKTTTVSEAARHCKTSEAAIKTWLRNFDEFASGPAADGDDN